MIRNSINLDNLNKLQIIQCNQSIQLCIFQKSNKIYQILKRQTTKKLLVTMKGATDFNMQIKLSKIPSSDYPLKQTDIFQIKYGPPIPTDKIKQGQVVIKNLYISIDAAMRTWINGLPSYVQPVKIGNVMNAKTIGQIIYSNCKDFKIGQVVLAQAGWEKYSVVASKKLTKIPSNIKNYAEFLALDISGLTAYFGFQKIGNLKPKQVVVISAAAGGVGQIAVQYAKSKGCTVVAIAGGAQKCKFVKQLGADIVIDYKKQSIKDILRDNFKLGIDVYFDNVGGQMLDDVLMNIKDQSRIILCGAISNYNHIGVNQNQNDYYRLKNYPRLIIKRAVMKGFIYMDYKNQYQAGYQALNKLLSEGKLKVKVHQINGLDECPNALIKLLKGQNTGKVIVKVTDQQKPQAKL